MEVIQVLPHHYFVHTDIIILFTGSQGTPVQNLKLEQPGKSSLNVSKCFHCTQQLLLRRDAGILNCSYVSSKLSQGVCSCVFEVTVRQHPLQTSSSVLSGTFMKSSSPPVNVIVSSRNVSATRCLSVKIKSRVNAVILCIPTEAGEGMSGVLPSSSLKKNIADSTAAGEHFSQQDLVHDVSDMSGLDITGVSYTL